MPRCISGHAESWVRDSLNFEMPYDPFPLSFHILTFLHPKQLNFCTGYMLITLVCEFSVDTKY